MGVEEGDVYNIQLMFKTRYGMKFVHIQLNIVILIHVANMLIMNYMMPTAN